MDIYRFKFTGGVLGFLGITVLALTGIGIPAALILMLQMLEIQRS